LSGRILKNKVKGARYGQQIGFKSTENAYIIEHEQTSGAGAVGTRPLGEGGSGTEKTGKWKSLALKKILDRQTKFGGSSKERGKRGSAMCFVWGKFTGRSRYVRYYFGGRASQNVEKSGGEKIARG